MEHSPFGKAPICLGQFDLSLSEVMYYLYLPVQMEHSDVRLPPNVECCRPMIYAAITRARVRHDRDFRYVYLSARKGWATPDNPLNRPGWHCDGFGTPDLNFVWWQGPGTRFAIQQFNAISPDHIVSLRQFEAQVHNVITYPEHGLYELDRYIVHATPEIEAPGCMRQYVKISLSDQKYNLYNNSHNYLFDYDWKMLDRAEVRNDPYKAQAF